LGRFLLVALAVALLAGVMAGRPGRIAAQDATTSAEQQLADKYAPIAELREQEAPCDRKGEAYFPAPVELVLGNPEVVLKRVTSDEAADDEVVMTAPTAQDLVGKDDTYYLDFPGDPNHPSCTYDETFKRFAAQSQAKPTTYAHVVVDRERGRLVLQYWFWYYFNDWNNTHESDWELIQLVFDATTVEDALTREPALVGFAQHGGGETSDWTDPKLAIEDGHPIVHPGAGSHGTYYSYAHYIGWGEGGTGFGCDNTSEPATRTPLNVVVVPPEPNPSGPFAWLLFDGRWGQRAAWAFNGPNGPSLGEKWSDPIGAMEDWRTSSLKVPTSNTIGPTATDLFCSLSAAGSKIVIRLSTRPLLLVTTFLVILGAIIALFYSRRKELREAFALYRRHLTTFLGIGAFTIPIGIVFNGLAILVRENPPMEWVVKWFNDTAGARLTAAALVGGVQHIAMVLLIAPPVIQAVKDSGAGTTPGVRRSFRLGYRRLKPLAVGLAISIVAIGLLVLLLVGIPVAIWLGVSWQFFGQAIILDGETSGTTALRRSRDAVRGHWWHVLGDSAVFQAFALIPGPLVGALLMLLGKATVDFANAFSSIVYAFTVPISVIGLSFVYSRYRQLGALAPDAAVVGQPPGAAETAPA
jgi:hypothetical protein